MAWVWQVFPGIQITKHHTSPLPSPTSTLALEHLHDFIYVHWAQHVQPESRFSISEKGFTNFIGLLAKPKTVNTQCQQHYRG